MTRGLLLASLAAGTLVAPASASTATATASTTAVSTTALSTAAASTVGAVPGAALPAAPFSPPSSAEDGPVIRAIDVRPAEPVAGPRGSVRLVIDVIAKGTRGRNGVTVEVEPGAPPGPVLASKPLPAEPPTVHTPAEPPEPQSPTDPTQPDSPAGPVKPGSPGGPVKPGSPGGPTEPGFPGGPPELDDPEEPPALDDPPTTPDATAPAPRPTPALAPALRPAGLPTGHAAARFQHPVPLEHPALLQRSVPLQRPALLQRSVPLQRPIPFQPSAGHAGAGTHMGGGLPRARAVVPGQGARRPADGWETWRFLPDKKLSRYYPTGAWTVTATARGKGGRTVTEYAAFQFRRATRLSPLHAEKSGSGGGSVRVRGSLTRVDPRGLTDYGPFGGQRLEVLWRPDLTSAWQRVGETVTDAAGGFETTVGGRTKGYWRVRFPGTGHYASTTSRSRRIAP
ncbi:hypothetical protein Nocox_26365 [Nonomuraea coxensis DSM 45129]|uniref:Uncharacterized protein n=1 Tax=Nonomuraea coxensis DSM 45129 TaxID=1122611 RepID=A0ABX8U5C1_9ACTN|nr:hypothetical protein [Nonomuraea coxensis]QYC42874.1 hypothetical protein Nocox_26365 [Nonomuraea coxensis DSM 45129]